MRESEIPAHPARPDNVAPLGPELSLVTGATPVTAVLAADAPAAALYRDALVLDANTLASIGLLANAADAERKLQAVRDAGITALKTTLGDANGSFEAAVADIAAAQRLIEQRPDLFLKVTCHADLQRARSAHQVAVIFSFEAASMLEDRLDRIDLFRQFDVLIMQLTYNHKTPFGCACLDGESDGLTGLGRAAIDRMNTLGIVLDLSHANIQTTVDSIAASTRPPVITHAGCRAVFNHPRNKRDAELRALADKGGVVGIYMLPFLTPETRQPMLADYIQHMVHALDVCGEDHVGIGTDSVFFTATAADLAETQREVEARRQAGVNAPGENRLPYIPDLDTPRKLELVADALLRHGYGARITEKVLGLNFSRVFGEIWTA